MREEFDAAQGSQLFPCDWGFYFQAILDRLQLAIEMPDPLGTHSRLLLDGRLDQPKAREQPSHFQLIGAQVSDVSAIGYLLCPVN